MRLIAEHSPAFDPATPWADQEVRLVGETRLFQPFMARRSSPHTQRHHDFTRLLCPDWVNVVAFTPVDSGAELLLVEQFRHGIDASTLETIGGVCDELEEPGHAARRELLEETGYAAGRWVSLGSCAPNPAIQNNRCHFFLALDCVPVAELDLDPSEELRVWAAPWKEVQAMLVDQRLDHALVLAAMLRLSLWPGWEGFSSAL